MGRAGGVSVDHIVGTPELRSLASKVMLDVIVAANAELTSKGAAPSLLIPASFHDHMFDLTDKM